MPETTVAIIGAGIGGVYLAAELGTLGCRLLMSTRRRRHDTRRAFSIHGRQTAGSRESGHFRTGVPPHPFPTSCPLYLSNQIVAKSWLT